MEEIKAEKGLSDLMEELNETISKMENPEISLEESFELYKKGVSTLKACNDKIDKIEKEMIVIEEGEGE